MAEGPVALFHRAADAVVDGFRPEVERVRGRVDALEAQVFDKTSPAVVRDAFAVRGEVFALGRTSAAQRNAIERLARREFVDISTEMSFRFRDVYDHLVRITDEATALDHRLAGLLAAASGLAGGRRWI